MPSDLFLRGGILDWDEEVINPVLVPASAEEGRKRNERIAEVSRYFGGVPRIGEPGARVDTANSSAVLTRTRRRGC